MASQPSNIHIEFPSKNYSKYRSQCKTNPFLNKLSGDIGYPQDIIPSNFEYANKNYLTMNKKNLKNFFAERLPAKQSGIYRPNQTIDPSRIFQIKRRQYQLKSQTKTTLNKTIDLSEQSISFEPEKISEIFLVNDKNLDFKKKFLDPSKKPAVEPYESINFRRGTGSFANKYSKVLKKEAYTSVFGNDVSTMPKKLSKTHEAGFYRKRPSSEEKRSRNTSRKMANKSQTDNRRKKFSEMIGKIDDYRQKFDPDNKMSIKPYEMPIDEEDKEVEKNLMLTWIHDTSKAYKNQSINLNISKLNNLQDIEKMDEKYYNKMVNHKNKRLQIRLGLFAQGNVSQNRNLANSLIADQSTIELAKDILNKINNQEEEQIYSISEGEKDSTIFPEDQNNEDNNYQRISVRERFQKFGSILVHTLYQAKLFNIQHNQDVYNAFWKNPQPYHMSGSYAFFKTVKKADIEGMKRFLAANPEYLYERDHKGRSPLTYACIHGHLEVVRFLLSNKINVNQKCFKKRTALYAALKLDDHQLVKQLLLAGIEVWSTPECDLQELLQKNKNKKIHCLIKNARRVALAMSLHNGRDVKLNFWRENKHRITWDKVFFF